MKHESFIKRILPTLLIATAAFTIAGARAQADDTKDSPIIGIGVGGQMTSVQTTPNGGPDQSPGPTTTQSSTQVTGSIQEHQLSVDPSTGLIVASQGSATIGFGKSASGAAQSTANAQFSINVGQTSNTHGCGAYYMGGGSGETNIGFNTTAAGSPVTLTPTFDGGFSCVTPNINFFVGPMVSLLGADANKTFEAGSAGARFRVSTSRAYAEAQAGTGLWTDGNNTQTTSTFAKFNANYRIGDSAFLIGAQVSDEQDRKTVQVQDVGSVNSSTTTQNVTAGGYVMGAF